MPSFNTDSELITFFFITSCIADVQKDRLVLSSHPGPGNEEEVSSEVRK